MYLRWLFSREPANPNHSELSQLQRELQNEPSAWVPNLNPPQAREFYFSQLVTRWLGSMTDAMNQGSIEDLALASRCLILKANDSVEVELALHRGALDAGWTFSKIFDESFSDFSANPGSVIRSDGPHLVVLEKGTWLLDEEYVSLESAYEDGSFPDAFIEKLRALSSLDKVAFVTIIWPNEAPARKLQVVGGFDRVIEIAPTPALFIGERFVRWLSESDIEHVLHDQPEKLGLLIRAEFPTWRLQQLLILKLKRWFAEKRQAIAFEAIADIGLRGLYEEFGSQRPEPTAELKRKVACHEAGHAGVAILASQGRNIPEYSSIVPSKEFLGVVVESLEFVESRYEFTFADFLLKIRILLAGRAAEDYFFGAEQVSTGASSDLSMASQLCFRVFGFAGFHPNMLTAGYTGQNLAVLLSEPMMGESDQAAETNRMVKDFLASEYQYVLKMIGTHEPFFSAIADRLIWDAIVDQSEMAKIAGRFGITLEDPARGD